MHVSIVDNVCINIYGHTYLNKYMQYIHTLYDSFIPSRRNYLGTLLIHVILAVHPEDKTSGVNANSLGFI